MEPDFRADHDTLARLWVRLISVHYGAIARHWKQEGIDLLGEHAEKLTPQFRQMLIDAQSISAVDHALDDLLRTGVFVGLQALFERYDLIVSPTLAIAPVRNAFDGNTIGPAEIGGKRVDPLIGWCMTYPINFTGHPAISVPAGLTSEGLPVGLQIIGRRHADESGAGFGKPLRAGAAVVPKLSGPDRGLTGRVSDRRELSEARERRFATPAGLNRQLQQVRKHEPRRPQ